MHAEAVWEKALPQVLIGYRTPAGGRAPSYKPNCRDDRRSREEAGRDVSTGAGASGEGYVLGLAFSSRRGEALNPPSIFSPLSLAGDAGAAAPERSVRGRPGDHGRAGRRQRNSGQLNSACRR